MGTKGNINLYTRTANSYLTIIKQPITSYLMFLLLLLLETIWELL